MVPPPRPPTRFRTKRHEHKKTVVLRSTRRWWYNFLVQCQCSVMRSQRAVYREICCFHIREQGSCRGKGQNSPAPDFYLSSDSAHLILEMSKTLKKIFQWKSELRGSLAPHGWNGVGKTYESELRRQTHNSFFFIKALSVQSDHCMAMGCRIGDDSGPGRDGRRPGAPIPIWPGYP